MRIGIVSDTHMNGHNAYLPQALREGLQGVELILHAGDWTSPVVAELLEEIAPIEGVAGNNDGPDIIERFGWQKLIRVEQIMIGIVHGDGYNKTTEQRAYEAFAGETPDIILFGHSHVPYLEQREGVWMFNPGSPTDKRRQPRYSYGILEITDGNRIEAAIHYYDNKQQG
jgi:uncharacterized protein